MSIYETTSTGISLSRCPHCEGFHSGVCPRIKAIEYHENGTIKRVEYNNDPTYPVAVPQFVPYPAEPYWWQVPICATETGGGCG